MTETRSEKVDLKKELTHLYRASGKEVVEVEVPEMSFLMVDGAGDPNVSRSFKEAVEALYAVSYTLKFAVKEEAGIDYGVMPLEGLWWMDGGEPSDGGQPSFDDIQQSKDAWKWTMMILQPEWVTGERVERALATVEMKKELPALPRLRFEAFREGLAAQVMHVGPFSGEKPTVEKVDGFIRARGGAPRGRHHEIYLKDFRRTAPENLKTIIRHPFESAGEE
ncbi:MAG: GyrI-like domain-containing protein [Rubrobacteraceae bacterium]